MKRKNGFTLIELLAVIVVLAIIALIVTPIVSDIITSSKKAANARSVEGHVKDVQIAIMSKMFETESGDLSIYNTDSTLDSNLNVSEDTRVTCTKYVIRDGIVKSATGCRVDNSTETYEYKENEGAKEASSETTPEPQLPECDGCVYATSVISNKNEGSKTRPVGRNVYFKYSLVSGEVLPGSLPLVCGYTEGFDEICVDSLDYYGNEALMKEYFSYSSLETGTTENAAVTLYKEGTINGVHVYCQYYDDNTEWFECGNGTITVKVTDNEENAGIIDSNSVYCQTDDIFASPSVGCGTLNS